MSVMIVFYALIVVCAATGANGQQTHPAVVRVIAPEHRGASLGSGALVEVTETHGLVVTNWHVVRDAAGPVAVVFPDGFRSAATVMKTDRDWDLAALAVWRPNARPITLATEAPQPGEVLTIAGYGRGRYRTAAGRCTQYVSPGNNLPFEMVELSTTARNGDSGGPILNGRGELSGVLFGAASGRTTGSYCGRVRWFLEEPLAMLRQIPSPPTMPSQPMVPSQPAMIAQRGGPESQSELQQQYEPPPQFERQPIAASIAAPTDPPQPSQASVAVGESMPAREIAELPAVGRRESPRKEISAATQPSQTPPPPAPGRLEQIKTILAAIGVFAVVFHGLRWLGAATR